MNPNPATTRTSRLPLDYAIIASALAIIIMLSYWRIEGTPWEIDISGAIAGVRPVFGATFLAAMKVWSFWGFATVIGAGILLKLDPGIDRFDAILGGASGAWVAAYLLGQSLGPIGLFRAPLIWLLLIAGAVWILAAPTRGRPSRFTAGQGLALLAFGLAMVGLLPLELGSPAVPFMDVMSYPASVQRILSFGRYLPFDNDPYGCWGPQAQTPGLELFLAMLAMGSRVSLGLLAHSASIVPMAALMVFATYRLGAATIGDVGGGIAALMLFFTNTFRRLVGVRGTAVDLALVAIGLAFVLDRKSRRTVFALGCLILGTAVASHAIEGGLAIAVAALSIVLKEGARPRIVVLKAVCLIGAVMVAAPDFAISTHMIIAYPLLPLIQIAGIAAIVLGARALPQPDASSGEARAIDRDARLRDAVMVATFAVALMYTNTMARDSIYVQIVQQFPALTSFAVIGLLLIGGLRGREARSIDASPIVIALIMTIVVETLARQLWNVTGSEAFRAGLGDLHYKLDEYWTPYFLVFPAALPFAIIFQRGRRAFVIAALLAILIYPWNPQPNSNYDYEEHSIAEDWGIDISTAARGYWGSTPDPRWTMGQKELALVEVLKAEQEAGRITMKTHILHLAQDAIVWHEFNRFSVFTGINDDPIVYDIPDSDTGWLAGGRVRRMSALPEALAQRPPYILVQAPPPAGVKFPPEDYELIFNRDKLQLYRRRDLIANG